MLKTALRTTNLPANLKLAILIESVALIASVFIARGTEVLLYFVLLAAFQGFCGYLSNFRFVVACYLLAAPNIITAAVIAGLVVYHGYVNHWMVFWMIAIFTSMAFVAVLFAWEARRRLRDYEKASNGESAG